MSPASGRRPRVLLVDDSTLVLTCLRRFVETRGMAAVIGTAGSGREALREAKRLDPDLVLMDLHMPEMNGLEATRELLRALPRVRVIIMTVEETARMRAAARAHGAHGFVGKACMVETLAAEIRRVVPSADCVPQEGNA